MRKLVAAVLAAWLFIFIPLHASAAERSESDLDYRTNQIATELRCLVCQNQTIADSHASLAVDLKNEIKEMLKKGKTEEEIKAYMVERYGDFVLYKPPVKSSTLLLWVGPIVFMLVALAVVVVVVRRRPTVGATVELTEAERKAAARLLDGSESKGT